MVHEYDKIFMENCQLGTEPGEDKKEKKVYLTNVHTSNKRGGLSPASFLLDHLSPFTFWTRNGFHKIKSL